MDLKSIEALLTRYYNGETSLEEERLLRDFFDKEPVPDQLRAERAAFQFYRSSLQEGTERTFDKQLISTPKTVRLFSYRRRMGALSAIAASVALLLGITFFTKRDIPIKKSNSSYGTYNNPQIAYAETKKALLLISNKLNRGNSSLYKISKFDEMQIVLSKKNK